MIEIPPRCSRWTRSSRKLDFLSIGTNDLIQYTLAVDRADEAVSHLYDPLHPAVAAADRAWRSRAPNKAKVPIAVCGEMAGEVAADAPAARPRAAQLLDASGAPADRQAARADVRCRRAGAARRADAARRTTREAPRAARQAEPVSNRPRASAQSPRASINQAPARLWHFGPMPRPIDDAVLCRDDRR